MTRHFIVATAGHIGLGASSHPSSAPLYVSGSSESQDNGGMPHRPIGLRKP
jgi:hypothetical protein